MSCTSTLNVTFPPFSICSDSGVASIVQGGPGNDKIAHKDWCQFSLNLATERSTWVAHGYDRKHVLGFLHSNLVISSEAEKIKLILNKGVRALPNCGAIDVCQNV